MAVLKSRESLAVKYRPKRLEHLVGQDSIVSLLQGQFRSKHGINRSFLIHGSSGCGKTTVGRIIAHYINCEHFDVESCSPCGKCDYCKDVEKRGYYGGVEEINFSDSRGVDTVRAVIDSTAYASQYNAHVFICDEVHQLTGVAQNAFLKVLEEPPDNTVFILLTTDPQKLLNTIINRCCPLTVSKVDVDELAKHLLKICQQENRDYFTPKKVPEDPEKAKLLYENSYAIFKNIAMFSNGLVRQAMATLEAVLCMIEGGERFDPTDPEPIRKIIGKFVESPSTEIDIFEFLIQGVYSGRYGNTLNAALKLAQGSQVPLKQIAERCLDTHLQILYFMVDPNRKMPLLTDPFYSRLYSSVLETVKKPGAFQLTHQAAADMVATFMQLISDLGLYVFDERRLLVAASLKMLDAVNQHKHMAYTKKSVFHKIHAPNLLIDG